MQLYFILSHSLWANALYAHGFCIIFYKIDIEKNNNNYYPYQNIRISNVNNQESII